MKFLFTHRPLYCFDNIGKEACHQFNEEFYHDLVKIKGISDFNAHFSGHVHMY